LTGFDFFLILMSVSSKIEIGVVGLGRTGWRNHLLNLEKLPDLYKIAAVADALPERRSEAEEKFGCRSYPGLEEMLQSEELPWVVIATPTFLHCEQTCTSLNAGANVICEKPMAPTLEEARTMLDCAQKANRHLTVFQQNRYASDFVKVREIIESGLLGRVFQVRCCWNGFGRRWDWQTLQKNGGGNLNNTGPHPLDQMLQLFGEQEPTVACQMEHTISAGDADDHVKIFLRGKGSPSIDLEICSADAFGDKRWKVYGTCGGLSGSSEHLVWKYFNPEKLPPREVDESAPTDRGYHREVPEWENGEWCLPPESESAHLIFYRDLHARLSAGEAPRITAKDALRLAEISELCRESSNSVYDGLE